MRITYEGALYHVFSKGDKGEYIFSTDRQKGYFAGTFIKGLKRYKAELHAFCIMGNHYHLLLRTPQDNLSALMHFIGSTYASYFQRERGISGHVFNGRYRSLIVETNEYVLALTRYIHRNPVRAGLINHPMQYRWSSYRFFADQTRLPDWLNRTLILDQLDYSLERSASEYRRFVERGLDENGLEKEALAFDRALESPEKTLEKALSKQRDLKKLMAIVCQYYGISHLGISHLSDHGRRFTEKEKRGCQAFIYLARMHTDASNKDIAQAIVLGEGNTSYHFQRIVSVLKRGDPEFERWTRELSELIEFWGLTPEFEIPRHG